MILIFKDAILHFPCVFPMSRQALCNPRVQEQNVPHTQALNNDSIPARNSCHYKPQRKLFINLQVFLDINERWRQGHSTQRRNTWLSITISFLLGSEESMLHNPKAECGEPHSIQYCTQVTWTAESCAFRSIYWSWDAVIFTFNKVW